MSSVVTITGREPVLPRPGDPPGTTYVVAAGGRVGTVAAGGRVEVLEYGGIVWTVESGGIVGRVADGGIVDRVEDDGYVGTVADGFGVGLGTCGGDWSGIRDSSDEATSRMFERCMNIIKF